jgi:hypothetical protein
MDPQQVYELLLSLFTGDVIKRGWKWIKLKINGKEVDQKTLEYYSKNAVNIENMLGGVIQINVGYDRSDPAFTEEGQGKVDKFFGERANGGEKIGILFVDELKETVTRNLNDEQKNILKFFGKPPNDWSKSKLGSLKLAFKIVNMEDDARTGEDWERTQRVMAKAFGGRMKVMNRKMYNLARAGYIQGFAFRSLFSPREYDESNINKILGFFPEAIFINQEMISNDIDIELGKRSRLGIKTVAIYARGAEVAVLEGWKKENWGHIQQEVKKGVFKLYIPSNEQKYTIGFHPAVRLDVMLYKIEEIKKK